ncbi:MAG: hypothetical protein A2648_00425 [Candidatus Lloydbacteria bacterium RIFCSPHIGHO2_01_FULL_41_20]|uniref:Band 7 domain-containing protein n=1 Tax=Candidatus Lloydbacteria bacterium RIFCSPHIGHO2_01_FULL_41_20 TaxID=1798657 RepID=A0A1G2CS85_9BACT|nr:MAG: hypothetical protein A2648_00425 [Candidatus Lloydbacteria bacterium RIFCSPHIGHO2_01_FULL_41_20]
MLQPQDRREGGVWGLLSSFTPRKGLGIGILLVIALVIISFSNKIVENVDADEIVVIQSPIEGRLDWYIQPGIYPQWFGKVTRYKKRSIYDFNQNADKAGKCTNGIDVRFNDGGHGTMCGSVQYDMPLDVKNLTALHTRFGSQEAVQRQLVETITGKSVYLSGPLMSSRESYAEKRNDLIHAVEDQIQNGVYRTFQEDTKVKDPLTGQEKSLMVVRIVMKDGHPERQEDPVLTQNGLKASNFTINRLPYDPAVEKQIQQQQSIAMDVQTAIANAKKAEQDTITVSERGKADAAKAKWDQEVIKAREVTAAEQRKAVADLDVQTAGARKREQILLGEGEAERRKLVMSADGALDKKLEAWVKVNEAYATAVKDYKGQWVPGIVMAGQGSTASAQGMPSGAQAMIDFLTVKTAKDLAVDMGFVGAGATKGK